MSGKARSFTVTMGQAFYASLPAALRELGGRVWSVDRGAVEVRVHVSFPAPRTADALQRQLWARDTWACCSIGVDVRS